MSSARVKGRRSPCQGCEERFIGCHAVCQSYIDFSNSRKEENRKRQERNKQRFTFAKSRSYET